VRRKETAAFSPDPAVLFRRYGPAMLWGHWEADKLWQASELPNALRFILFNNSGQDWEDVSVTLDLPPGWQAQGRGPRHWERPDRCQPGPVVLRLGRLASGAQTVAPFWLRAPGGKGLLSPIASGGFGSERVSLHTPSQPGEGICLVCAETGEPQDLRLSATLEAYAHGVKIVETAREVPLRLEIRKVL
jgi:hypothetical protein